jgi:hypothetical protein
MTPPPASMPGVPAAMPVMMYPEASQAVVALVLSIVGIVACGGVLCPVGWYLGSQEMKAIDAGRRDPSKRDLAQAAKIIGIIGTALVALAVIAVVGFAILAIIFSASAN